jgi:hypothetical protein
MGPFFTERVDAGHKTLNDVAHLCRSGWLVRYKYSRLVEAWVKFIRIITSGRQKEGTNLPDSSKIFC